MCTGTNYALKIQGSKGSILLHCFAKNRRLSQRDHELILCLFSTKYEWLLNRLNIQICIYVKCDLLPLYSCTDFLETLLRWFSVECGPYDKSLCLTWSSRPSDSPVYSLVAGGKLIYWDQWHTTWQSRCLNAMPTESRLVMMWRERKRGKITLPRFWARGQLFAHSGKRWTCKEAYKRNPPLTLFNWRCVSTCSTPCTGDV